MNKRQAKKKGKYIDPKDTWCLDVTIARYILPRLRLFKKLNNGYPISFTPETWNEELDKMIWSFEKIADEKNSYYNINLTKKENEETIKKIREGLDSFSKYYFDLWW